MTGRCLDEGESSRGSTRESHKGESGASVLSATGVSFGGKGGPKKGGFCGRGSHSFPPLDLRRICPFSLVSGAQTKEHTELRTRGGKSPASR